MFKIIEQPDKKYTVYCYYYSEESHSNKEIWVARNMDELDVAKLLQGRSDKQLDDMDFAFAVVKSGNGPAILTGQGDLMAASVKVPITLGVKNATIRKRTSPVLPQQTSKITQKGSKTGST